MWAAGEGGKVKTRAKQSREAKETRSGEAVAVRLFVMRDSEEKKASAARAGVGYPVAKVVASEEGHVRGGRAVAPCQPLSLSGCAVVAPSQVRW